MQSAVLSACEDVTAEARQRLHGNLAGALEAIAALSAHFDRELVSSAIAELSERLIAEMTGATRMRRGMRGYDLLHPDIGRIEVKARVTSRTGNAAQFNLRESSRTADSVYCLAWDLDAGAPRLQQVILARMDFLLERFARGQPRYCVRTSWGALQKALAAPAGHPAP